MSIGENIRDRRKQRKMTLEELSRFAGVSRQTLSRYENGIIAIPNDRIEMIAKALETSPAVLMGWDTDKKSTKGFRIPVLGSVPAGIPLEAIEDIVDYEEIPETMARNGEYFGLRVSGESMVPVFNNGDTVIIQKQESADTGDYVVAMINGNEATLKRLKRSEDGIMLIPQNPEFFPATYTNEQIESLPVRILGKVIELRRKF